MNCFDSFLLSNFAPEHLSTWGTTSVLVYIFIPSLPYAHVLSGPLFFSLSLSFFLDLFIQKKDLFQASQSVAAKMHHPCRYFAQSFFSILYYHPHDAHGKWMIFSLVSLHSCINLIPILSGWTISPLSCFWCAFLLHGTTKQAPAPLPHTHLCLSPFPSGDLCETPLGSWAPNCSNWLWYGPVADLELHWFSSGLE